MKNLDVKLEGLLFYKASPMKKAALKKLFEVEDEELKTAMETLQKRLSNSALSLVISDSEVELTTVPELDELIENLRKDDIKRDIGKAGAETLAIVLYRGPVNRADIDRIRGVNSSYILRNLMIRGLVEKQTHGKQVQFAVTTELLKHLGVDDKTKLTNYSTVMNALEKYEAAQSDSKEGEPTSEI